MQPFLLALRSSQSIGELHQDYKQKYIELKEGEKRNKQGARMKTARGLDAEAASWRPRRDDKIRYR